MEEVVAKFISDVTAAVDKLVKVLSVVTSNSDSSLDDVPVIADSSPAPQINPPSLTAQAHVFDNGILNFSAVVEALGLKSTVAVAPEQKQLPSSQPAINISIRLLKTPTTTSTAGYRGKEWSVDNPYHAGIRSVRWLTTDHDDTNWEGSRRVLHMGLDLGDSGISYQPGDSIGICCPNPESLVMAVIERLKQSENDASLSAASEITFDDGTTSTLGEFVRFKIDLTCILRKSTVFALASQCRDEQQKQAMQWLCSKDAMGKALWATFIEQQGIGLAEILLLFPSCMPSFTFLASIAPKMYPRFYSIASSPLKDPLSLSIAFSVVRFICVVSSGEGLSLSQVKRSGLCTSYLEGLTTSPDLKSVRVRIYPKPSSDFHLPASVSTPLILVGPGTGVAPFVGFLEHLQCLKAAGTVGSDAVKSLLFFGCRGEADYLYREELGALLADGSLSRLELAQSRTGPNKVYVQHRMIEASGELVDLILRQEACVYVCGDGMHMARGVFEAFKTVLASQAGMTTDDAEALLKTMKENKRYVQDVWT
jgi:methionine synthase reductase